MRTPRGRDPRGGGNSIFFSIQRQVGKKENEYGDHQDSEDNDDTYGEIGANSRWRSVHDEDNNGTGED